MKNRLPQLLLWLLLCCAFSGAYAQDYYVSALTGSNANDGLTPGSAVATIQRAADLVEAGGTVFIMNGTYRRTTFGSVLEFRKSGRPDAYITFKPYPGHAPLITASGGSWEAFLIDGNASYLILEGLELEGRNADLTLVGAEQSYLQSYAQPAVFNAQYNTGGITLAKTPGSNPHHIIIRNCKIHDFPGGGIGVGIGSGAGATAAGCDYVTVENNEVYNNCWYTMYAPSGISVFGPKAIDTFTGYKIFVRGNRVYNNFTQVKWRRGNQATDVLSDGNGIILDANNGTQNRPLYLGRTLVENNVSFNNGGGGVHGYQASRIDIINNTAYNNGRIVGYPEIDGQNGTDVRIYNNIMYARTGGNCNGNDGAGVTYDFNVYYNGNVFRQGANDLVADPNFVRLATDANADFRLQAPSPALNSGSSTAGFFSAQDIAGTARPLGSRPERGAYEFQSGSQDQTISFAALPALQIGVPDFDPQATASSGLPVSYRSSNPNVAQVIDGKIQLVGGGAVTITATQGGDGTFAAAPEVSQQLTVDAAGFGPQTMNSTFDTGTQGWRTFVFRAPATIAIAAVPRTGYTGNALQATVTPRAGGGTFDVQLIHPMPVEAGKTYTIRFRASTVTPPPAPAGALDLIVQSDRAPFTTYRSFFGTRLTANATNYSFSFTPTVTDETTLLKFMLGTFNTPVFIDDVTITSTPTPVMVVKQGAAVVADNTPTNTSSNYNFGPVTFGSPKKVTFTIENTGTRTLNLLYAQKVNVTGPGFSLTPNAPAPTIPAGGSTTFEVEFAAPGSGTFQGNLVIANNDPAVNKNPFNFTLTATGVKADQTISFPDTAALTYGDAPRTLAATATSGLPVTYTLISGPGAITQGNVLSYNGVGELVVEATQAGSAGYNAAAPVRCTIAVNPKELLVTAENKTVTYGDPAPAYTYTITGFVPGETEAQISGSPELSSSYAPTTPATETPVIDVAAGSLSAANYRFTLVAGQVTINHTFPLQLEAETAVVSGGRLESKFAGYSGSGYVSKINKAAESIEWTANVSGAGVSNLVFRYAAETGPRALVLTVNGAVVNARVTFASTGTWSNWATVSVPVHLNAGPNTIRLSGSGSASPNVDHLLITNDTYGAPALARTSPTTNTSQSARAAAADKAAALSIQVYPVPASTTLQLAVPAQGHGEVLVQLMNQYGRVVSSKQVAAKQGLNALEFDVRTVPAGNYVLRVTTAEYSKAQLIQIER